MGHWIKLLLAIVLLPVAGWMLYENRNALAPYDPANDPNFPAGSGEPAENWRDAATRFGWQLDYAAGRETAAAENKPLMVVIRCIP